MYAAKLKKTAGPLILWARPNGLGHWRLGLSVGTRFGGAVQRNRMKRLLREAFRLSQHELPVGAAGGGAGTDRAEGGFDVVVGVRPHEPLGLEQYQQHLMVAAMAAEHEWQKRCAREARRTAQRDHGGTSTPD